MHALENFSATLLPTGKSTRSKSITMFVTALLLAMLAGSVAAQAQATPLVVTAMHSGRFYGDPNPAFTGSITGLKSGDNITAIYTTVANSSSPVGEYTI